MAINNPPEVASENTLRERLIGIIETEVPEIQYVTEHRAENLADELLQAFTAAVETIKPQKLDDQGTQVGAGWNLCVDEFDQRLAEMVKKK